jgi:hypothetical protein
LACSQSDGAPGIIVLLKFYRFAVPHYEARAKIVSPKGGPRPHDY